jgi:hypothetical protein
MMVGEEKEKTKRWKNAKRHARGYGACRNVQGCWKAAKPRSVAAT